MGYRAGGIAEVIRDVADGLLVRCGSIKELSEALERLALDTAERRRLGQNGRERVYREFQWPDRLRRVQVRQAHDPRLGQPDPGLNHDRRPAAPPCPAYFLPANRLSA